MMCISLALFFKVSDALSSLKFIVDHVEYSISSNDTGEQDQKKIETEYFTEKLLSLDHNRLIVDLFKKIVVPDCFCKLTYFPEVLTPPPLI